jgi:UDP-N-acetylmuramoyl-tripeptide--D-alanyl-D-alanine ligase
MNFIKKIVVYVLLLEARLIVRKYKPYIVAVTGSVGKTATKDAIFAVLSPVGHIRKSDKSFNSEIGIPLTIIGTSNAWKSVTGWLNNIWKGIDLIVFSRAYPKMLVLEVGADHPGDIRRVTTWLKPNIAVITRVFTEKAYLARAVQKGGVVVLYADEPKVMSLKPELEAKGVRVLTFGVDREATVRMDDYTVTYDEHKKPIGISATIYFGEKVGQISVKGTIGHTCLYPLLASVVAADVHGIPFEQVVDVAGAYRAPRGRMNLIDGISGSTLIDDTYNSSPDAVLAGLQALAGIDTTADRIAILGDMMELGQYSAAQHALVGTQVPQYAQRLVTVGPRSQMIADAAIKAGMSPDRVSWYPDSSEASKMLRDMVKAHDIVYIKGSQSIRMERITEALMVHPKKAGELLVRQESEWKKR